MVIFMVIFRIKVSLVRNRRLSNCRRDGLLLILLGRRSKIFHGTRDEPSAYYQAKRAGWCEQEIRVMRRRSRGSVPIGSCSFHVENRSVCCNCNCNCNCNFKRGPRCEPREPITVIGAVHRGTIDDESTKTGKPISILHIPDL